LYKNRNALQNNKVT